MKLLRNAISEGSCLLDLKARSLDEVFVAAVELLVQTGRMPSAKKQAALSGLKEREKLIPSTIGKACAVPHYYGPDITEPAFVFVRLRYPVNMGALDGIATRFIFLLLGPESNTSDHLDSLATIARLMSDDEFHFDFGRATTRQELLEALDRQELRARRAIQSAAAPKRTGLTTSWMPLDGIRRDIKRRLKHYVDDFRQGLRPKCLAPIFFLFFACLAPAVTFGGLMGDQTGGQIGAVEMLVATAICGVLYAVFAGQPMIILGGIGPMFVFTIILYRLCSDLNLEDKFLSIYGWIGLWTSVFLAVLAVTNAGNLMRFFTRFTDEIFSALMSLIFIFEAVKAIYLVFHSSFSTKTAGHDVAFLTLVLAMGTFYIAITLSRFRRSSYLVPWMREFLADFGPSIALASMAVIAVLLSEQVPLISLDVSAGLSTTSGRPWLVDLGQAPVWTRWAAAGPALLATVLIFLTQNITARLVNSSENRIQKGDSYHWDMLVVGGLVAGCSFFGFPWLVAATVRSLAHVRSLADFEEYRGPDGTIKEHITHTIENRVTPLVIHLLIGATLLFLPLLSYLPMAALYGVFLYMGVVSMAGNQFIERLGLWLMDSNLYPSTHYIRRVPVRKIHLFTLIQFVCLAILCALAVARSEIIRILFPIFIALLVPVRFLIDRWFAQEHLDSLDADEDPDSEELHWV